MSENHQNRKTPERSEFDQLLSMRLRETAAAWERGCETQDVSFDSRVLPQHSRRGKRLAILAPAIAAVALAAFFVIPRDVKLQSDKPPRVADTEVDRKVEQADQRLAELAERQRSLELSIQQLALQLQQQELALERMTRESRRREALATLEAVEMSSEGLLSEGARERLRKIAESYRSEGPPAISL